MKIWYNAHLVFTQEKNENQKKPHKKTTYIKRIQKQMHLSTHLFWNSLAVNEMKEKKLHQKKKNNFEISTLRNVIKLYNHWYL